MTVPTPVLKTVFVATAGGFCLLIGVVFGVTVFGQQGGHGLNAVINMFTGGGVGFLTGIIVAVILIFKFEHSRSAIKTGIVIAALGALMTFLFIQALNFYNRW